MSPDRTAHWLQQELHADPQMRVYAVLDGASVAGLRTKLWRHQPEHCCLFRDVADPALAEVAPYLVQLEGGSDFARWVLTEGWGNHWGIFARTPEDMRTMRRHCRGLLDAYDGDGEPVLLRYYDPRVLRVLLPACTGRQLAELFGPVRSFLVEDTDRAAALRYRLAGGRLRAERVKLPAAAEVPQPAAV
jgi:hypothetical protein